MNIARVAEACEFCREVKRPDLKGSPTEIILDQGADRCLVSRHPAAVVVTFRSSDNRDNWLSNLKAIRHAPNEVLPHGRMHKGFYQAGSAFIPALRDAIGKLRADRQIPVSFFGHSRGGPLAMFAAFALRDIFPVLDVITFGAPRWCDKVLAREYDMALGARTIKVVNNNDIVPALPPWRLGWQHVGRLWYIDRRGRVIRDVHALPFWDRFLGRVEDFGRPGLDAIKDHSGDNLSAYLDPLLAAVGRDET